MSFEKYSDLADSSFQAGSQKETIAPEDELFHSVYVAGKTRKNHLNITEELGKIQIRGHEYNQTEVYMIITHTKEILCKVNYDKEKRKENVECFSYKEGSPPWHGTSKLPNGEKRVCPMTSAERGIDSYCGSCRAQLIVAGLRCHENGKPFLKEDKKPVFIFIRGKGMRYANISEYLSECFKAEYPPLFEPATEESTRFEKTVVNNKRCVTKIVKGEAESQFGSVVNVFSLSKGEMLKNEDVLKILEVCKKTIDDFNKKFDWSKGKETTGYTGVSTKAPEGVMTVEEETPITENKQETTDTSAKDKAFSFDEINF